MIGTTKLILFKLLPYTRTNRKIRSYSQVLQKSYSKNLQISQENLFLGLYLTKLQTVDEITLSYDIDKFFRPSLFQTNFKWLLLKNLHWLHWLHVPCYPLAKISGVNKKNSTKKRKKKENLKTFTGIKSSIC